MGRYRSMLFVVLMLFGIFVVMQFRTVMEQDSGSGPTARELAERLDAERNAGKQLVESLSSMETEYGDKLRRIGKNQGDSEFMTLLAERDSMFFRAGLTAVKGSGIVMILNDAAVPGEMALEDYIIHDSDIVPLLNELRMAGAEAISINGERVLGMTKTVCAGPTILINNSRYPVPFEFKAIGDPEVLYEALENSESVGVLRLYDIRVEIRTEPDLTIEKYRIYDTMDELMTGLEVVVQ
jgi:uncharacterized protein YlxW (UPF0749 family)